MIVFRIAPRFVRLVQTGVMTHLFDMPRQVVARPGRNIRLEDAVSHRPVAEGTVTSVERMEIIWTGRRITGIRESGMPILRLEAYAHRLGYADIDDMAEDFEALYGCKFLEGLLVEWRPTEAAALEVA